MMKTTREERKRDEERVRERNWSNNRKVQLLCGGNILYVSESYSYFLYVMYAKPFPSLVFRSLIMLMSSISPYLENSS